MNVREWALPVYTILMQLAVGALFVLWLIRAFVKSKFSSEQLDQYPAKPDPCHFLNSDCGYDWLSLPLEQAFSLLLCSP